MSPQGAGLPVSEHVSLCISSNNFKYPGANSVFAQTILDLAQRKPHLIFGKGADPYII